ncbi:MAG: MFS transporter [Bacteroidetes bacterium]|nr:MFS transporter [Bacteroidota bacterium]
MSAHRPRLKEIFNTAVIVAALGYFVDIYDLILFSIVRIPSLRDLGLTPQQITDQGLLLLNVQMFGMLLGGILWGILGDKKGRIQLLFGSILLYSVANIANGFVQSIEMYAVLRFIAGVGLAGELGGGITLVSEIMPKETRGYGTMIIATVGVAGAVLAYNIVEHFDWRNAYFIGGGLGLALLVLRVSVFESGMFNAMKETKVKRGDFIGLFNHKERFYRYMKCVFIGLPTWYCVGILITLSPEFAKHLAIDGTVSAGRMVMFFYLGLIPGDFLSGVLSQIFHSRRKILATFLLLNALGMIVYFLSSGITAEHFYYVSFFLGLSAGYWAIFVTNAAEQFGTNMRATVATTVPNMARGATIPISLAYAFASSTLGTLAGAAVVGVICLAIAMYALYHLDETFGKDLDFVEN